MMGKLQPTWVRALGVLVGSLLLGGATSFGQTWLPDSVSSVANSASGWTTLTALLVWLARPGLLVGATLGVVGFVGLVVGYTAAAELRGFAYDPIFWSAVGVVAGPFVGAAAAGLARRPVEAAVGSAVLAGILVSEGIYGLTEIADTTSPAYWSLAIAAGAMLVAAVAATRLRTVRLVGLQFGVLSVAVAGASVAYAAINAVASR